MELDSGGGGEEDEGGQIQGWQIGVTILTIIGSVLMVIGMSTGGWIGWKYVGYSGVYPGACNVATSNVVSGTTVEYSLYDAQLCQGDTLCGKFVYVIIGIGWFIGACYGFIAAYNIYLCFEEKKKGDDVHGGKNTVYVYAMIMVVTIIEILMWMWVSSSLFLAYPGVNFTCSGYSFWLVTSTLCCVVMCMILRHFGFVVIPQPILPMVAAAVPAKKYQPPLPRYAGNVPLKAPLVAMMPIGRLPVMRNTNVAIETSMTTKGVPRVMRVKPQAATAGAVVVTPVPRGAILSHTMAAAATRKGGGNRNLIEMNGGLLG